MSNMDEAEPGVAAEEPTVTMLAPTGQCAEGAKGITVAVRYKTK